MSVLVGISVVPLGAGESASRYVAKAVKVIEESGLPYTLTPMETVIEGETWEEVMDVVSKVFHALESECNRLVITIKVDYRKGRSGGLIKKIESVKEKLKKEQ